MFINTPEGERFEITDKKIVDEVLSMIVYKRSKTEIAAFVNKLIENERSKTIETKRKIWYGCDEKPKFIQKVKEYFARKRKDKNILAYERYIKGLNK